MVQLRLNRSRSRSFFLWSSMSEHWSFCVFGQLALIEQKVYTFVLCSKTFQFWLHISISSNFFSFCSSFRRLSLCFLCPTVLTNEHFTLVIYSPNWKFTIFHYLSFLGMTVLLLRTNNPGMSDSQNVPLNPGKAARTASCSRWPHWYILFRVCSLRAVSMLIANQWHYCVILCKSNKASVLTGSVEIATAKTMA